MTPKLTTLFVATAILAGLGSATVVLAEEMPSSSPPGTGIMRGQGGMMGMIGHMSGDHMKQMVRMIESCNRMIEGRTASPPANGKASPEDQG
jgi:hypothetical protein